MTFCAFILNALIWLAGSRHYLLLLYVSARHTVSIVLMADMLHDAEPSPFGDAQTSSSHHRRGLTCPPRSTAGNAQAWIDTGCVLRIILFPPSRAPIAVVHPSPSSPTPCPIPFSPPSRLSPLPPHLSPVLIFDPSS
ncbi:hypothetical protein C8J57DRAFT_1337649, partial [Mycena rebaudengoi]